MTQIQTLQALLVQYNAQAVRACELYDKTHDQRHFDEAAELVEKINETADTIERRMQ